MNFKQQSDIYLQRLQDRKRHPVRPATTKAYGSYIDNWIVPMIGAVELEGFGNAALKEFAQQLVNDPKRISPKTIAEIIQLTKKILSSATDPNGDQLYPRTWNVEFIDAPVVVRQRQPVVTQDQVNLAMQDPNHGAFYAVLAGTGLRIGEALALRWGRSDGHTSLCAKNPVILVRTQLYLGVEQPPKTQAGIREIDLDPSLWNLIRRSAVQLRGEHLFPYPESTLRFHLRKLGIPGFHSFRRYRITRLREVGCPEDIIKYWVGHAGQDITDRYSKLAENRALRAQWAVKAGLGFELPKEGVVVTETANAA